MDLNVTLTCWLRNAIKRQYFLFFICPHLCALTWEERQIRSSNKLQTCCRESVSRGLKTPCVQRVAPNLDLTIPYGCHFASWKNIHINLEIMNGDSHRIYSKSINHKLLAEYSQVNADVFAHKNWCQNWKQDSLCFQFTSLCCNRAQFQKSQEWHAHDPMGKYSIIIYYSWKEAVIILFVLDVLKKVKSEKVPLEFCLAT